MIKILRRGIFILALILIFALASADFLGKRFFENYLSDQFSASVKIAEFDIDWFSQTIYLDFITVASPPGFAHEQTIFIDHLSFKNFTADPLGFEKIEIDNALYYLQKNALGVSALDMIRQESGRRVENPGAKIGAQKIKIGAFEMRGGVVHQHTKNGGRKILLPDVKMVDLGSANGVAAGDLVKILIDKIWFEIDRSITRSGGR